VKYLLKNLKNSISIDIFSKKWRKKNKENTTTVNSIFDINRVFVGRFTYGQINPLIYGKTGNLFIGSFCSIGPNVTFIVSSNHEMCYLSTFPFKVKVLNQGSEAVSKGDIIVEDDVWIGANATILSGIRIGQGAVIGANTVVTHNVLPYAIVCGNPSHVIGYRFSESIIHKLLNMKFSKLSKNVIDANINTLYTSITEENVDLIIKEFY